MRSGEWTEDRGRVEEIVGRHLGPFALRKLEDLIQRATDAYLGEMT